MLIGHVEVYAQHAAVFIGKDTEPSVAVSEGFTNGKPAEWDDSYLLVRNIGSEGLTSVYLWYYAMPAVGEVVFDGTLHLPDGRIRVFDLMTMNILTRKLWGYDPSLLVRVDEPGKAARVDVGIETGRELFALRTAAGHPLPPLISSARHLESTANEFAEILADRDAPVSRLAAAILLLVEKVEFDRIEWRVSTLQEWLRQLSRTLRYQDAVAMAADIAQQARDFRLSAAGQATTTADEFAVGLAAKTWASISAG